MTGADLIGVLQAQGVWLSVVGDRVHVKGPAHVVTPALRDAIAARKSEIVAALATLGPRGPLPAEMPATVQHPVSLPADEIEQVRIQFERHGTQPAWDDLVGAAQLERQRTWCEETLDAVYRGKVALFLAQDGRVSAFARTAVS